MIEQTMTVEEAVNYQQKASDRIEQYREVMNLRPRGWPNNMGSGRHLSIRQVSDITGVKRDAIRRWWNNESNPMSPRTGPRRTHCGRGHLMQGDNVYVRSDGGRSCKACRRVRNDKLGSTRMTARERQTLEWKARGEFHKVWNPDPEIAPLHMLWVKADEVLALLRRSYTDKELYIIYNDGVNKDGITVAKMSAGRKGGQYSTMYTQMLNRSREWLRFDSADGMLCKAGLMTHMLPTDPVYSGGRAPS